jgi:hypothetical protein
MEARRLQKSNGRLLSGRSIIEDQLFALIASPEEADSIMIRKADKRNCQKA